MRKKNSNVAKKKNNVAKNNHKEDVAHKNARNDQTKNFFIQKFN